MPVQVLVSVPVQVQGAAGETGTNHVAPTEQGFNWATGCPDTLIVLVKTPHPVQNKFLKTRDILQSL